MYAVGSSPAVPEPHDLPTNAFEVAAASTDLLEQIMAFYRGPQSPRDEQYTNPLSPPQRNPNRWSASMAGTNDVRGALHRRFTTNTVPQLSPIGQQRRQAAGDVQQAVSAVSLEFEKAGGTAGRASNAKGHTIPIRNSQELGRPLERCDSAVVAPLAAHMRSLRRSEADV